MRKFGVVKTAFPLDQTSDRLLLLFWGLSDEARFQNLVRVDRDGNALWRAELPGDSPRDCFVSLKRVDGIFVAQTFSGRSVRVEEDGQTSPWRQPAREDALIH